MENVIFIFSLPRSGSTLLQRILDNHSQIKTTGEPWILLPYLYTRKNSGAMSEYGTSVAKKAIEDFLKKLPDPQYYNKELSKFILNLYASLCDNNEKYFLDKTPRYHYIIEEINEIFPNAKFIFLFRNPVHIYSSILKSFTSNRFYNMHNYNNDLRFGIENLASGYLKLKDKSIALNYEDLVLKQKESIDKLISFLEIEDENLNNISNVDLGIMGDKIGIKEYSTISPQSFDKWKSTFNSKFRKNIIKKYIKSLSSDDLENIGYSKIQILEDINTFNPRFNISMKDYFDYLLFKVVTYFKLNLFLSEFTKWSRNKTIS